jgi:hypothetical protein
MQLLIQGLRVLPLLLVRRQPILPEDDMVAHRQGEDRSRTRCDFAPTELGPLEDTREGTRLPSALAYCCRWLHVTSQYKFRALCRQVENRLVAGAYQVCT